MEQEHKKKSSLVQFRLSGPEREMLDQLLARFGSMTSEYLRSLIREKHARVFPAYTTAGKKAIVEVEPELTPEQACESVGGKVESVNGVMMCVIPVSSAMKAKVPLSDPKLILKYKKP